MTMYLRAGMASVAIVLLAGCGGETDTTVDNGTAVAGAEPLPSDLISRLVANYPVLGEEEAPEPQPGDNANPAAIPVRYREAAPQRVLEAATGQATYYADKFEGRRTASGIPFRQNQLVAAHRGFPFGTLLRVTNVGNDRSVNVRVVDRGPFGNANVRPIIDLSRRAATELGFIDAGRASVRVEVLEWGDGIPSAS